MAAKELYQSLTSRESELFVVGWQNDAMPRERVRSAIRNCLHDSLLESYDRDIFAAKSDRIYQHIVDRAMMGYAWVA